MRARTIVGGIAIAGIVAAAGMTSSLSEDPAQPVSAGSKARGAAGSTAGGIASRSADAATRLEAREDELNELHRLREELLAERENLLENEETTAVADVLLGHVARIDARIAEHQTELEHAEDLE